MFIIGGGKVSAARLGWTDVRFSGTGGVDPVKLFFSENWQGDPAKLFFSEKIGMGRRERTEVSASLFGS